MPNDRWVKSWQSIEEWRWYKTPNMAHLWQNLIRKANWKDSEFEGVTVRRGQLIAGRKALAEQTGISEQSVRTCLERLKSTSEITIKPTSKFSIITILNYELYQSGDEETNQGTNQQSNQQLTSDQPASNQQVTTSNNNKKNKNIKKVRNSIEDARPESRDVLLEYFFDIGLQESDAEKFYDHFESNGWLVGGKSPMKDWRAAARNWKRNKEKFGGNNNGNGTGKRKSIDPDVLARQYEKTYGSGQGNG